MAADHAKVDDTNATSSREERERLLLRDRSELEGTLLLPNARPVAAAAGGGSDDSFAVVTAAPVTYFSYGDNGGEGEYATTTATARGRGGGESVEILDAPNIPSCSSCDPEVAPNNNLRLDRATQKGLIEADQESDDISKQNRKVYAVNYFIKESVKRGNEHATLAKTKEDAGLVQTSAAAAPVPPPPPPPKTREEGAQDVYKGTYGSEYKVAEYELQTDKYETEVYDVAEYKSIYES